MGGTRLWLFLVGFSLGSSGGFLDSGGFWRPLGDLEGSAGLFLGPPILLEVWSPEGLRLHGGLAQEFLLLGLQLVHFL